MVFSGSRDCAWVEDRVAADDDGARHPEQVRAEQKRHQHEAGDHGQEPHAVHRACPAPSQHDDGEHEHRRDAARDLHEDAVGIAVAGDRRERNEVLQVAEPGHDEGHGAQQHHRGSEVRFQARADAPLRQRVDGGGAAVRAQLGVDAREQRARDEGQQRREHGGGLGYHEQKRRVDDDGAGEAAGHVGRRAPLAVVAVRSAPCQLVGCHERAGAGSAGDERDPVEVDAGKQEQQRARRAQRGERERHALLRQQAVACGRLGQRQREPWQAQTEHGYSGHLGHEALGLRPDEKHAHEQRVEPSPEKSRADDDFDAGRPVHPFQRFHASPSHVCRIIPQQPNRTFALGKACTARDGSRSEEAIARRRRRWPTSWASKPSSPSWRGCRGGRELRGSGRRRRLVRSREEVGDRPARSGWFRDGCDGSARLMCGEIGFLAVIGFLSGMPRGKTPGRVFLRFRNGERNRAQTAKSSISPHVDPPARRPGSRSRRLRAAFGREAAGWRATVLRRLPFFARSAGQSPSSMWWALPIRSPICCDFCNIL